MPLKLTMIQKPSAETNSEKPHGENKHKKTKRNNRHKSKHQHSNSPSPSHRRHHDTLSSNRPSASPRPLHQTREEHRDPFSISEFIQGQMYTAVRSIPGIRWLTDTATHPIIVAREKLSKFDTVVTPRANNTDGSWLYPQGNRDPSKNPREIDIDSLKRSHKKRIKKERRKARKKSREMRIPIAKLREMFVDADRKSSGCSFDFAAGSSSEDRLFTIGDVNAGSYRSKRSYRPKNLVNVTPKCNSEQGESQSLVELPTSDEFRFTPRLLQYESVSGVVCNVASSFDYDQRPKEYRERQEEDREDSDYRLETHEVERQVYERREGGRLKEIRNTWSPEKRGGSCAARLAGYNGGRFQPDADFVGNNSVASFSSSEEAITMRRYLEKRDSGLKFVWNNRDEVNHRAGRTSVRPLADEHVFETGRPIRKSCASGLTREETAHNGLNDFSDENFLSMPKFVQVLPSSEVSNSTFLTLAERQSARKYEPKPRMQDEYEGLFVGQSDMFSPKAAYEGYEIETSPEPMTKYVQVLPNSQGPQLEVYNLEEQQSWRKYEPKPRMQDEYEGHFAGQKDVSSVTSEVYAAGNTPEEDMGEYIRVLPNVKSSQSEFYNLAELQSFGKYEPKSRMQDECIFVGGNDGSLFTKETEEVEVVTEESLPSHVHDLLSSMEPHPVFNQEEQLSSSRELYRNPCMQQDSVECINEEVAVANAADVNLVQYPSVALPVYRLPCARRESEIGSQDSIQLKTTCNIFQFSGASLNQAYISDEKCKRFEPKPLENVSKNVVELNELRNRTFQMKHEDTDEEQDVSASKLEENHVFGGNPEHCGNSEIEGKSGMLEVNIDNEDLTEKIKEDTMDQNENNENNFADLAFKYAKSDISEYSDNEVARPELKLRTPLLGERPDLAEKLDRLHVELEQLDSDIEDLDLAINERLETDDTDDDADMPEELGDSSGGCPVIWENSSVVDKNIGDVPSHNFRVLPQRNRWHDLKAPTSSKGTAQQKRRARESTRSHARISLANSLYDALVQNGIGANKMQKSSENLTDTTTQTDASIDDSSWDTASRASSSSKGSEPVNTARKLSVERDAVSIDRPMSKTPRTSPGTKYKTIVRGCGKMDHVRIPETAIESGRYGQATSGVSLPAAITSMPNANSGVVDVNETSQEILLCENSKAAHGKLHPSQHHFPSLHEDHERDDATETASDYEASISDVESNNEPKRTKKKSAFRRLSSSFQRRAGSSDVDSRTSSIPAIATREKTVNVVTGVSGAKRGPKWYHRFVPGKRLSRVGPTPDGLPLGKVPTPTPTLLPSLVPRALQKATML